MLFRSEFVEDLPKTISGKIRRNVLRDAEIKKHVEAMKSHAEAAKNSEKRA